MAFRLGDITEKTEQPAAWGRRREIACSCWFTSKGKSIPQWFKVMDEQGSLHTVRNIEVFTTEEKSYAGIETIEHLCRIEDEGQQRMVKLIFTKENCKWAVVEV